jgi:PKD repeat protein
MMRHFSWKAFLLMVLLVVVFVAVYSVTVYAQTPPIALPGGPYTSTVGKRIHFDASGSFDPDPGGFIIQYIWNFGDGYGGAGATPYYTHVYESAETYSVVLTVISNDGQGVGATVATISSSQPQDFCKGDFNYDGNVDANDVTEFLLHFGRSQFFNPCPPDGPAPVAKTWQAYSYATGDDGDLQKGVMWPGYGNDRWTDNENGTVTDNLTGLIWLKNANCWGQKTWNEALSECNGLSAGYCGLTDGSAAGDWRLPSRKEFISLFDDENYNPALPTGHPFSDVQLDLYWSSTTKAGITSNAWVMSLIHGSMWNDIKTSSYHVWPVSGGR